MVSNARNYNYGSASFASPGIAAPGSIVSIFANGLGSATQATGFPDTNFQGVQVTFNNTPAPLFHLVGNSQQIDLYVPEELPTSGTVNVQLSTPTATYPDYTLTMAPALPGLYRIADPNVSTRFNVIAQFNGTAGLAMPASTAAGLQLPACSPLSVRCRYAANPRRSAIIWSSGLPVSG